jgi:phytoene/squalene synthetase
VWWRDALAGARGGNSSDIAVMRALAETLATHDLPEAPFEAMIAARTAGRQAVGAADYAAATVGSLMQLWALVLGADADLSDAAIAYGLAGEDTDVARAHYQAARARAYPKAVLPAVLPAALVPLYLKRAEPPPWRKQIALLHAGLRGRI